MIYQEDGSDVSFPAIITTIETVTSTASSRIVRSNPPPSAMTPTRADPPTAEELRILREEVDPQMIVLGR